MNMIKDILVEDINKLLNYVSEIEQQNEAYENMIKEAIKYIHDKLDRFDCDGNLSISMQISYCKEDLLNILNKVSGSDE